MRPLVRTSPIWRGLNQNYPTEAVNISGAAKLSQFNKYCMA